MSLKIGNIELYMGPAQLGAPDDLEQVVVDFIDGAQRRLDIAVQELENRAIAEAIVRARQRELTVRLVLEADYLTVNEAVRDPWVPGGNNEENRFIHDAILRAKIKVRSDFNTGIFHQKFIVRDGSELLTGSTNFTPTGVANNLNHIVIVRDEKVAKTYGREFREIQQGHFGKRNEGHDPAPSEVMVSDVPVKVLFAPDHSPEMEIMKQMVRAKSNIMFAIFTFSQSSGIDDIMIQLSAAGVKVSGALDSKQGNQEWAATRPVRNAGADLFLVRQKGELGKLHHKLMVIDDQVIIAGSFNYTGPANRINDENIIILGDLETTEASSVEVQKKLARFAKDEIERIIFEHGERL